MLAQCWYQATDAYYYTQINCNIYCILIQHNILHMYVRIQYVYTILIDSTLQLREELSRSVFRKGLRLHIYDSAVMLAHAC
jgi:hypothetical protein